MAMGEARVLHKQHKQPVLIVGRDGRPVKNHGLFEGVPYLLTRPTNTGPYQRLVNGPGARPYIAEKTPGKWTWRPYKPKPAELVFTTDELAFAEPYRGMVMIEPNVKAIGHINKAWLPAHWVDLADALRDLGIRTVQCVSGPGVVIGDHRVPTANFRLAAAVLSVCKVFIGTEGGLQHAAAAVGVPSVVVFGGFISPDVTGYAMHRSIFTGSDLGCGVRTNCDHCRKAMSRITPGDVIKHLDALLRE